MPSPHLMSPTSPKGQHESPSTLYSTTGPNAPSVGSHSHAVNMKPQTREAPPEEFGGAAAHDVTRIVEDPQAYRPATPILTWRGPRRGERPPKLQFWISVTVLSIVSNVISGVVPGTLHGTGAETFLVLWIAINAVFMAAFTYMSTSRHLQNVTMQMEGINRPQDIDNVLESLQDGRFSRFEETWKVQVHLILMFCRLLRHHHGVSAIGRSSRKQLQRDGNAPSRDTRLEPRDAAATELRSFTTCLPDQAVAFLDDPVRNFADERDDDEVSFFSAVSDDTTRDRTRHEGEGGSPKLQKNLTTRVTSKRKVDADPLGDNLKTWAEVSTASTELGPQQALGFQLLKQVKVGQDLSKVVLPVHILEPRSLLEKLSDLFVHPELLGAINGIRDPLDRIKGVCRWFLSAFHMRPRGVKKPYNPVLAETFECVFSEGTGDELWYFAEQVSHHPPITCLRALHKATGIEVVGSFVPRSRLVNPNTGASVGEGFIDLIVPRFKESYRISWPSVYVSGILSAPLRLELVGSVGVNKSVPDCRAEISFIRKPLFGGDYDDVVGGVFEDASKNPSFVINGKWHSKTEIRRRVEAIPMQKQCRSDGPPELFFDPLTRPDPVRPMVHPTTAPKPSRCVWKSVTVALRAGDAEEAQRCKNLIESRERDAQRTREARGDTYVPGFFRIVGDVRGPGRDTWRYIGPPPSIDP